MYSLLKNVENSFCECVYSLNEDTEQIHLWQEIRYIRQKWGASWCLVGFQCGQIP